MLDIHQSIDRILDAESILGDSFYEVFLKRFPQLQQYFEGVNLRRQAVLLTMALLVIEQHWGRAYPAAARYLHELGAKHRAWGIPREAYASFSEALLETLRQFHGDDWNESLHAQWREAIDSTARRMLDAYQDEPAHQAAREEQSGETP